MIKLDLAMRRVKETSTFNGMGFFSVDRTTLTAMLSTTVTYLIVLVQNPSSSASLSVEGRQNVDHSRTTDGSLSVPNMML
jgi:hypothetical protein